MTPVIDRTESPLWANWLGIMALIFGILLLGMQGTELLKHSVMLPDSAAARDAPPRCPEYDLEKDGLSIEYCHAMAGYIKSMIVTTPSWYRDYQVSASIVSVLVALVSIFAAIALIDNRRWAVQLALITFSILVLIDVVSIIATYNSGPLLRSIYLWDHLLWFFIHMILASASITGMLSSDAVSIDNTNENQ